MAKEKGAVADQLSERQQGNSEPPHNPDVLRNPKEGSARGVVGTLLFYVALPAFLIGISTPLYSSVYWLKTGEWKNVTLIDLTPALAGWRPNWAAIDYLFTQAHVALPTMVLAVILFLACAFLLSD